MRANYDILGVEGYYKKNNESYQNPHFPVLKRAIGTVFDKLFPLLVLNESVGLKLLDIACGSGEVTVASKEWADKRLISTSMVACDPFTSKAYFNRIGQECLELNFQDIASCQIDDNFDIAFCSFALHLCPESLLYSFMYALSLNTKYFIILSPHKKPVLKDTDLGNFQLKFTWIVERIHIRVFESHSNAIEN
jgi:hypothetical protein